MAAAMDRCGGEKMTDASGTHDVLCDIWDAGEVVALRAKHPDFFQNPLNMLLSIAADGFSVSGQRKENDKNDPNERKQSLWPVTATIYNLPACIRTKMGACAPLCITPLNHFHDVSSFLEPVVDELILAWHGITIHNYGGVPGNTQVVRVMLVHLIADYPALAKLLNCKMQPTPKACFFCHLQGIMAWTGKVLYGAFYRWLPHRATDARAEGAKVNITDHRGNVVATQLGACAGKPPSRTAANNEAQEGSFCAFERLPYWDAMLMASYDAMHAIGDCVKMLFEALTGISKNTAAYEHRHNK